MFRKENLSSSDIRHNSQCDEQPAEHLAALEVLQHGPQDPQLDPHDLAADQREGGQRHPAHRVQEPVLTAGRYRARFFIRILSGGSEELRHSAGEVEEEFLEDSDGNRVVPEGEEMGVRHQPHLRRHRPHQQHLQGHDSDLQNPHGDQELLWRGDEEDNNEAKISGLCYKENRGNNSR